MNIMHFIIKKKNVVYFSTVNYLYKKIFSIKLIDFEIMSGFMIKESPDDIQYLLYSIYYKV